MSALVALKTSGLLARKGEATPALVKAAFNDPALAWGDDRAHAPMTWEDSPAAGLTPLRAVRPAPAAAAAPGPARKKAPAKAKAVRGPRHAFTARLPMPLYRRLKEEAARSGRPMTQLVAEALGQRLGEAEGG
ncbi:hypothetical protein ACM64Y_10275 [Novispirillum sp. DQ9]|uniref:hypothetical protein n=1 Tax=Novispirillum sp. DQ9 TaxID=3398612 RepID=UPI003C7DC5C6